MTKKKTLFEVTTANVDFVVGEVSVELSDEARESLYRLVKAALAVYLKPQVKELILDQLGDSTNMEGDER